MDARFDENKTELGVLVLSVAFKVLADGDGLCECVSMLLLPTAFCNECDAHYLLDQHIEVLRDFGCEA